MRIGLLIFAFLLPTWGVSAAPPDEASLTTGLQYNGASYCYRVSSWHENPNASRFVVTFYFFHDQTGQDGVLTAYDGGVPVPLKATATIETYVRGKRTTHTTQLNAKAANEMACRFGYSGFFASDSNDPTQKYCDGHGLTAERLYAGKYDLKTRTYEESLSCKWLYDFLENFVRQHG